MMYVLLHDELVELPTASTLLEVDGHVALMDEAGLVVARFNKLDIIAYSANREKLAFGLIEPQGQAVGSSDGHRDGLAL